MTTQPMAVKLIKKILLAAPEGAYLVSNCFHGYSTASIFEEIVAPPLDRENQWKRVVAARADQRLCRVFATQQEHQEWLQKVLAPQSKDQLRA